MKINVKTRDKVYLVEIEDITTRPVIAHVEGEIFEVWPETGTIDEPQVEPDVAEQVEQELRPWAASPVPGPSQGNREMIKAPIPGVILTIRVKEGDEVQPGEELCVLEAMKMKNMVHANQAGWIAKIHISVGDSVSHSQILMELEGGGGTG